MTTWLESPWLVNILSGLIVSIILLAAGYAAGQRRERRLYRGKQLEEYDFYPFSLDKENRPFFDLVNFRLGVYYFLKHRDYLAARQLILLGEQNAVRQTLGSEDLREYLKLYRRYDGEKIFSDASDYLENYKRIVKLVGRTFPDMGIEVLLHNLSNPAHSLAYIDNNVTGRKIEDGATNLVLDLKMRKAQGQDKVNYELNIGARKFKCTTIPIYRRDIGLIGAVCINIDVNYIGDEVLASRDRLEAFFRNYCKTEMVIEENILSKEEYAKALAGKRHWRDLRD
jgi:predicted transcriptional regulator YheO